MDRAVAKTSFQQNTTDLIDNCPHCDTRAHIKLEFSESHELRNRDVVYYAVFRCVPCKKLILKTFRFSQNTYDQNSNLSVIGWEDKYPNETIASVSKFDGIVPNVTLSDFKEGTICLQSKCHKAAVSMFRRALQSALLERGANPKTDLVDQIKNATFLTQDIKDWAHNIRIFGNWGAHPQDDNLKDIDPKIAEETQSFLEEFFNYVYVMPSRVASARIKNAPPQTKPAANSTKP